MFAFGHSFEMMVDKTIGDFDDISGDGSGGETIMFGVSNVIEESPNDVVRIRFLGLVSTVGA